MKKLFLSIILFFTSGLSSGNDDAEEDSEFQRLCAIFMEESHPCHEEGADESILEELKKRGIIAPADAQVAEICDELPRPPTDDQ